MHHTDSLHDGMILKLLFTFIANSMFLNEIKKPRNCRTSVSAPKKLLKDAKVQRSHQLRGMMGGGEQ